MSFKITDRFSLQKVEKIKETGNKVYFYEHNKTKAVVLQFENQNENAAFGLYFKTPVTDSKGTAHILEHSVFEGSRKYNQSNSLDFILNSSLASHFNASTYLDKTGYHFASSFEKDYLNLLDIYLDFIFFPKLEEKTLRKEGHFLKKNKNGYEFNGIVFNEMKNSQFGVYHRLYRESLKHIFPNTNYSNNSGGDPLDIVDLTHEELLSFHKEYYHPTNSYTVVYGKINKRKVFQKLDEYFSEFELKEVETEINNNAITEVKDVVIEYQDKSEDVDYTFSKDYLLKNVRTEEDYINFDLVMKALLGYDFSPLRREIEDSKLTTTFEYYFSKELKTPGFSIIFKGVKKDDVSKLSKLVDEGIVKVSKNISKDIKDLIIKRFEFSLKENEFYQNQGVDYIDSVINFLNYEYDPLIGLRRQKNLKIIKKTLTGKRLEEKIQEYLGDSLILNSTLVPKTDLIKKFSEELKNKLDEKISKIDLEKLDKEIEEHEEFLESPKIEPKYKSLKKIKLNDIDIKIQKYDSKIIDKVYTTKLNSQDIIRADFNFDVSECKFIEKKEFGIYLNLLNQISSKNYKFDELSLRRNRIFGKLSFNMDSFNILHTNNRYLVFSMYLKFLLSDKNEVIDEIFENTLNLNFKDKERIEFLLKEQLQSLKDSLVDNPMQNSTQIAKSYLSEIDYLRFNTSSLPIINFLEEILNNYDENFDSLSHQLEEINKEIFSKKCLVNLGTSDEYISEGIRIAKEISKKLDFEISSKDKFKFLKLSNFKKLDKDINLFYPSTSDTNFNIMGVVYEKFDNLTTQLLGFVESFMEQYLWDEVRIKSGAYGSRFYVSRPESYGIFYSYSDPKINETYKVYTNTKSRFNLSKFKKYSFEKMKIKYLSNFKTIHRNHDLFEDSFSFYLREVPDSHREGTIKVSKELSYESFKELVYSITKVKNTVKVIATTRDRIKEFKEKFEEVKF